MSFDQIAHTVKQLSGQQDRDQRYFVFAHIANYDPATHRVRCIVPSWRDEDGSAVVTPWIPLGTLAAGGMLVQFAPKTGATTDNPTGGELVVIQLFDRARGTAATAMQVFSNAIPPPSGKLDTPLAGGEGVIYHADSGTYVRFMANGDLLINSMGKTTVTSKKEINVSTEETATVTAKKTVTVIAPTVNVEGADGDTLHKLVMDSFQAVYNSHQHGNSGPPDQQMTSDNLTSILNAE